MILTSEEKQAIAEMDSCQTPIKIDDELRSNYQYEIEKPSRSEWRVSKFAILCLAVEYFSTPEELYKFIK